jgi:hypothetical protein
MRICTLGLVALVAALVVSLAGPVRAGDMLEARMDRVDEGMTLGRVLAILNEPNSAKPGKPGSFTLYYRDPVKAKVWAVTFENYRVDSIEAKHE